MIAVLAAAVASAAAAAPFVTMAPAVTMGPPGAAVVLAAASDQQPPSGDTLKVLTYNLHGLLDDGNPPDWDPVRTAWLVDVIENLDPDIVGFQEILQNVGSDGSDNQLRALAESLAARSGSPWEFRVAMSHVSWDRFKEGVGILSKHPIQRSEEYLLTAKDVFHRKLLGARIATPLGEIDFFTAHLAYRSEAESTRVAQVTQIRQVISSREEGAPPAIVVGDFNAGPGSRSVNLLTKSDSADAFVDVFRLLHPRDPGATYPASDPTRRIDYVFVTDADKLKPVRADVILDELVEEIRLSDHLGVYVEFEEGR